MADGHVPDALIAEHGFSMLVTVTKAGREHRFLFDAGTSPDGVTENMRRLDIDPSSIEAIVCSHGHFDHTTGIDGMIRAVGRMNMPVVLHPHFWRRRQVVLPGREPRELPTTSAEPRGARARALHRMAGPARDVGPVPRRLHPERGRYQLPPVTTMRDWPSRVVFWPG